MPTFLGPYEDKEFPNWEDLFMKNVSLVTVKLDFDSSPGPISIGDLLPQYTNIFQIIIDIESPFNGTPVLTIGNSVNVSEFMASDQVELSETGLYAAFLFKELQTSQIPLAYWNNTGVTTGSMKIMLMFSNP